MSAAIIAIMRSVAQRDAEIERQLDVARPILDGVIRRYAGSGGDLLGPADVEDLTSTILLRLVARLRADGEIASFPDYVATIAFNAVNDHFRRSYPERTHVRNRLRYALGHDRRLALWTIREQLAGGLAEWRGQQSARDSAIELPDAIVALARDRDRPAETLVALFRHERHPFFLRVLIEMLLPLWQRSEPVAIPVASRTQGAEALEWKQVLETVWREILELRPLQRKALLLNLRDAETSHALELFADTGVATMDALARALEMTPSALAAIWSDLPLDDLRIAAMLGLNRQQVINLRKSARERLARRVPHRRPA
jgi:DNA-directed RNA polymerase specialized sigma24 family protein